MATAASQSLLSASGCAFSSTCRSPNRSERARRRRTRISFSASSSSSSTSSNQEEADCNAEECAPDKEVGKVSVEWLAGEKTKVAGTYPPKKKGWTGYVEKDTAGQTNIYSVEPAVYVAESGISSGTAGTSGDEAGNTVAVVSLIALIAVAAASNILLQVGKNTPTMQAMVYSGPPLGYYINKFKPVSVVKSAVPAELESAPSPGSN